MSKAETTEVFRCTPEQFYAIITDFDRYHEFLSEVKKCQVVQADGNKQLVEYRVEMMKSFTYRLWMNLDPPHSLVWQFDSGDLFKKSDGSWRLEKTAEGHTRATYGVEAKFKVFVPGPIAKTLINVNLPNMMSSYHQRVEELYGG